MKIYSKPITQISRSDLMFYIIGYGLAFLFGVFIILWLLVFPVTGLLWFLGVI